MYTAKERVCITADGTAVKADDPKGVSLLASEGTQLSGKQLARIKGWKKFFKGTNLDEASEADEQAESQTKARVAPEPTPAKSAPIHIKK